MQHSQGSDKIYQAQEDESSLCIFSLNSEITKSEGGVVHPQGKCGPSVSMGQAGEGREALPWFQSA